jgi:hypothetical protein
VIQEYVASLLSQNKTHVEELFFYGKKNIASDDDYVDCITIATGDVFIILCDHELVNHGSYESLCIVDNGDMLNVTFKKELFTYSAYFDFDC